MVARLFEPRFLLLYGFVWAAVFVHLPELVANTLVRASKTQNIEGEPVGLLNRVFGYFYRIRLLVKSLKARSRFAYYTLKYVLISGLFYWIFLA